ncbi:helix-turn-helix domain-containing protein [Novipirellula caenicola]|uniref:Helix-turn-helix domain-containing protein n=1 Tax=Novipirellula caenicola TaxID=1536901 RepID=A0ABP9VMY1_9BACT
MADYLSLEDAAKKLGIPTDRLVELRSQGEIRGFRDGASWKFPENEIARLADELADRDSGDLLGGSGDLVSEMDFGSGLSLGSGSNIIGGDDADAGDGSGSDVELGIEPSTSGSGSDVNLITGGSDVGSDVALVASDSDDLLGDLADINTDDGDLEVKKEPLEIDSGELSLAEPAISHDSAQIDLSIEPNAGSTGPVTDAELKELLDSEPTNVLASESGINLGSDIVGSGIDEGSDLSFAPISEEDSDDIVIGADDSELDILEDDVPTKSKGGSELKSSGMSSLELMDELDSPATGNKPSSMGLSGDVLSELDLLGAEQGGSGLISGDSENLLASSGLGSSLGLGALSSGAVIPGGDDALSLDDDDDLLIADDDDDLVIDSAEHDLSVAGDSGINLMSPSDSGLSLESEPLDLAGSSVSALDLGGEISHGSGIGSSASGVGGDGSMVDFQADEEFQLSPSGIGLESEIDSDSQVIEVEDSELIGEPVDLGGDAFGDADAFGGDAFDAEAAPVEEGFVEGEEVAAEGVGITSTATRTKTASGPTAVSTYEVPFTLLQCLTLVMIIGVLSLGGMLMTDLLRNMWTYTEPSAPVSSLTDSLISLMGW